MFKHPPAQHATDSPAGQLVSSPKAPETFLPQTLKQEINRIMKHEGTSLAQKNYNKGYADGYVDGKKDGFQEALLMIGGMV